MYLPSGLEEESYRNLSFDRWLVLPEKLKATRSGPHTAYGDSRVSPKHAAAGPEYQNQPFHNAPCITYRTLQ